MREREVYAFVSCTVSVRVEGVQTVVSVEQVGIRCGVSTDDAYDELLTCLVRLLPERFKTRTADSVKLTSLSMHDSRNDTTQCMGDV